MRVYGIVGSSKGTGEEVISIKNIITNMKSNPLMSTMSKRTITEDTPTISPTQRNYTSHNV